MATAPAKEAVASNGPLVGPPIRPLLLKGARDLRSIGKPLMLIEDIIPVGSIVLVSGPAYSGKTFFALEAARAIATGESFMGRFPVERPGNVLIVEQDSPEYDTGRAMWSMLKRQWHEEGDQARADQGFSVVDPIRFSWHPDLNILNRLDATRIIVTANKNYTWRGEAVYSRPEITWAQDGSVSKVERIVEEQDFGWAGTSLIVLDTMRALHKGEENDSGEMEAVIQNLKYIRRETGAAIIAIAHDGVTGERTRGSTAWDGGVDSQFNVVGSKRQRHASVLVRKARAIAPPEFRYTISTRTDDQYGEVKEVVFKELIDNIGEAQEGDDARKQFLEWVGAAPHPGRRMNEVNEWSGLNQVSLRTVERWLTEAHNTGFLTKSYVQEGRARMVVYAKNA